jgi:hypothetical protein
MRLEEVRLEMALAGDGPGWRWSWLEMVLAEDGPGWRWS